MNILVVNAGSSSLKMQLMDMQTETALAKAGCERIGIDGRYTYQTFDGRAAQADCGFPTHTEAFEKITALLADSRYGVLPSLKEIDAVGNRVVQGAELFSQSVIIDERVVQQIESLSELAPLHNPAHVQAIRACWKALGKQVPQAAVFDTSFHQTIPAKAYLYGLPYQYYKNLHIRKYGFHGTSHRYVSERAAELMDKPLQKLKLVSCHLGNGSSICAVEHGRSVETTMGFTPLDGILMGTRAGSVDPSAITYLMKKLDAAPDEIDRLLNRRSGLYGISGVSSDYRDVKAAATAGNTRAQLALDMLAFQIRKSIAACASAMDGLDGILFTGGIGENAAGLRSKVCRRLKLLDVALDETVNAQTTGGKESNISAPNAGTAVWVIPTNEELMIARDTQWLVSQLPQKAALQPNKKAPTGGKGR